MPRTSRVIAGLFLALGWLALAAPVHAVITRLTSLDEVIDGSPVIFTATVESLDRDRPSLVLAVDRALKGKAGVARMPVLLKGDAGAIKRMESPKLLARVAPKLSVIAFVSRREKEHSAIIYTNGTWLSL